MKLLFKQICEENENIPLFLQYSWFDQMYQPEEWNVCISKKGERVSGIFPYVIKRKKGFNLIINQHLCPFQGIWINYPVEQNKIKRISFEKEVMQDLIHQLPKFDLFRLKFDCQIRNWLPFYWLGFKENTRYTYLLKGITDQEKIVKNFKESIRRQINKAEKNLTVSTSDDILGLFELKKKIYQNNQANYHIDFTQLEKAFNYSKQHHCGELIVAKDENHQVHSYLFYVWDNQMAYYLHGATEEEFKSDGSMSLLLWEAIKRSSKKVDQFNFEGSMVSSIEQYFRYFGGELTPYFEISKVNSFWLKLLSY